MSAQDNLPKIGTSDQVAWLLVSLLLLVGPIANAPALRHALGIVALFYCLNEIVRGRIERRWLNIFLPWMIVVLASALWSLRPKTTLVDAIWEVLGPISAGVLAMSLAPRVDRRWLAFPFAALAIGCVASVTGGLQVHFGLDAGLPGWLLRTYPGRGVASTVGVLVVLVGIWMMIGDPGAGEVSRNRRWRAGGVLMVLLGLLLGILGHNRMFWFAVLIGLLPWLGRLSAYSLRIRLLLPGLLLIAALTGVIYSSVLMKVQHEVGVEEAVTVMQEKYASDPRWIIWTSWGKAFLDQPVIGYGYGTRILPRIGETRIPADIVDAEHARHHAHNVFLNVLVQTGVFGMMAFLWMLAGLFREIRRSARESAGASRERWASLGAASLLLGALAKALTDDFYWGPANIVMWVFVGLFIGLAAQGSGRASK